MAAKMPRRTRCWQGSNSARSLRFRPACFPRGKDAGSRLRALSRSGANFGFWTSPTPLDMEGRETLLAIIAGHRASGGMLVMASHGTLDVAASRTLALDTDAKAAA